MILIVLPLHGVNWNNLDFPPKDDSLEIIFYNQRGYKVLYSDILYIVTIFMYPLSV